jgi:hypothetical protein
MACRGDQSEGVAFDTPSFRILEVESETAIEPLLTNGILFRSQAGENVTVRAGEESPLVMETTREAILAESIGVPSAAPDDPFLGLAVPGSPAVAGGIVRIESRADITTDGAAAHGLHGNSRTTGFPPQVILDLLLFDDAPFQFSVTSVADSAVLVGQSVQGVILDEDGEPVSGRSGGTFIIHADGSSEFVPGTDFDDLAVGGKVQTVVPYELLGVNTQRNTSEAIEGWLVVTVERTEAGLVATKEAYFDRYGPSQKPSTSDQAFPDLRSFASRLLVDALAGGIGGSVTAASEGAIETKQAGSHGVLLEARSGDGGHGRNGSISRSATEGGRGKDGGDISGEANGHITTRADESIGMALLSRAGNGGHGGEGGTWRYGQRGGTGGTGGEVVALGGAAIETFGELSTGILAFSEGGNGGDGGSGDFVTSGGRGGFGGLGGMVDVDGAWNVTTHGDKAHGIWAKSVGGVAGTGGSGGWLAGSPAPGGQASDGGSVTIVSGGRIETGADVVVDDDTVLDLGGDDAYGLYAQSVGGFGGRGGEGRGIFYSSGGDGASAGSGGEVAIEQTATGSVTTRGARAHGLFAQSIGGGGGSGGGSAGLVGVGGSGSAGGHGGNVTVSNAGAIDTFGANARGIYAQSVGGGGGDGGNAGGLVAIGGRGSGTSDGGVVTVENSGAITTQRFRSYGIFAESVGGGGGDGGDAGGLFSIGGSGGGGGHGNEVTVTHRGSIDTGGAEATGLFAQSVGGGGGNGGGAVAVSDSLFSIAVGGDAGAGGVGRHVRVSSEGDDTTITTDGAAAHGILAQSVGGGGGNGGFAVSGGGFANVSVGGTGGGGGAAGRVDVYTEGRIETGGSGAHGAVAQSIGGGGGSGGFAVATAGVVNVGVGGSGGGGGAGQAVNVGRTDDASGFPLAPIRGEIETAGERAYGLLAQSVGGGGGNGGFAVTSSVMTPVALNLSFGGEGGSGNAGGQVNVSSESAITTHGNESHALFAQSVGGGGGSGGGAVSTSVGGAVSLNLAFGGDGGTGGAGGAVRVGSDDAATGGVLTTSGDRAFGMLAQSVGGGGGSGGSAIAGALLNGMTLGLTLGGDGGTGGAGGDVTVRSGSTITTDGKQSHGLLAQSVGGGGGSGGLALDVALTALGGLDLAFGGDGGIGATGGTVDVRNSGAIETLDEFSHAIFAQSIGGGGGSGGSSGAVTFNFSSLLPVPPQIPIKGSANFSVALGGDGGMGGAAGTVDVRNEGTLATRAAYSHGVFAQSVGGGGGDGGSAVAVTGNIKGPELPEGGGSGGQTTNQVEVKVDFALALGGNGGDANHGSAVTVQQDGDIETEGLASHGVFAQSVGGGGGQGGDARAMTIQIDPMNWVDPEGFRDFVSQDPNSFSFEKTINVAVGGDAGGASDGGIVNATTTGRTVTRGADAHGVLAQSIGGGGGLGGGGYHGLDWAELGVPESLVAFFEESPLFAPIESVEDMQLSIGGSGGAGGHGEAVNVTVGGGIETWGDGSFGVLAQSVGGGGGTGGVGAVGSEGARVVIGGGAGAAGDGRAVTVHVDGGIETRGIAAHGVFAQSVGGGGGLGGNVDRGVQGFSLLEPPSLDLGLSGPNLAFGRSGGSAGDGGAVELATTGTISTQGSGASGIFAQSVGGGGGVAGAVADDGSPFSLLGLGFAGSAGGDGSGGDVRILHAGDISTRGERAHGIFAQSAGGGADDIVRTTTALDAAGKILRDLATGEPILIPIALPDRVDRGGAIEIDISGNIVVSGSGAHGIYAQSSGADGSGDVIVRVSGGRVQGGSGEGAAIRFSGGAANTLENRGTLLAWSGIAVLGTTGDDHVENHGTIYGEIDLGAGANAFYNRPDGTLVPGTRIAMAGGPFQNEGRISLLGGPGTQTTVLEGSLVQASTASLQARIDPLGAHDRLDATGTATLGGTLEIERASGRYRDGTSWRVLAADGGIDPTSAFAREDLPDTSLLDFRLVQHTNALDVALRVLPYRSVARSIGQQRIADHLERLDPADDSDLWQLIGEFQQLRSGEHAHALQSLSPQSVFAHGEASLRVAREGVRAIGKRLVELRIDDARPAPQAQVPALAGVMYLVEPPIAATIDVASAPPQRTRTLRPWVSALGVWGEFDGDSDVSGYDFGTSGSLFGVDLLLDRGWLVGAGGGFGYTDLDLEDGLGGADLRHVYVHAYASWTGERAYANGIVGWAGQDNVGIRHIQVGSVQRRARGSYDSDAWSAYAESGLRIPVSRYTIEPFASLEYVYLDQDRFEEGGAHDLGLVVDGSTSHALRSQLGARMDTRIPVSGGELVPRLGASWTYDHDVDDARVTAAFSGAQGGAFTLPARDPSRSGLRLDAELRYYATKSGIWAGVSFGADLRRHFRSLGARLELGRRF